MEGGGDRGAAAAVARERAAHAAHASRAANERIRRAGGSSSFFEVVCECARPSCTRSIAVTREEYEDVRSSARQFIVATGHVDPGSEVLVEEYARYVVVRKVGAAAAVAEALARSLLATTAEESRDAVSP